MPARVPYLPDGLAEDPLRTPTDAPPAPPTPPAGEAPDPALPRRRSALVGWVRWTWRQLTSMRVALLLLMLLAVAALPGSFFPQRPQAPERVAQYLEENPTLGPWLDRLGLFDVFASPWFAAIYLLLFVSLVGCIVPRATTHLRALRADPPRVPRSFARFPVRDELVLAAPVADVERAVVAALRGRYRTRVEGTGDRAVRAERGYLRESGNLVFHLALVGVLVAMATGELVGYRGQVVVIEGRGFANAVVDYHSFESGPWFRDDDLVPFSMTLDRFTSEFDPVTALARDFAAEVTVREADGDARAATIRVNHPLPVGGARIFLSGNGYAPALTVRDGAGEVAFSGPVPFLPQDQLYTSRGVVKVPDVSGDQAQIGFVGFLLPTAVVEPQGARSVFPQPLAPLLLLTVYAGDLGLDDGVPQNVYELDTSEMTELAGVAGEALVLVLEPGQTAELPDGLGSITFEGVPRFASLDLRHDPAIGAVLVFALVALGGLALSLFVPRRRLWVRMTSREDGRTVIAAAALARGEDPGLRGDLDRVLAAARAVDAAPGTATWTQASTEETT